MRIRDVLSFARGAALGNPSRTALLMLAMAIGVAAVVVLIGIAVPGAYMTSCASCTSTMPPAARCGQPWARAVAAARSSARRTE